MGSDPAKIRQHQELLVVKGISKVIDFKYPRTVESSLMPKKTDPDEYRRLLESYIRGTPTLSKGTSASGNGVGPVANGKVVGAGGSEGPVANGKVVRAGGSVGPVANGKVVRAGDGHGASGASEGPSAGEPEFPENVSWGNAAEVLTKFLKSEFPEVRRLSASALGKLAPSRPACQVFLPVLAELAENDPRPQVRQYAIKSIGKYPDDAYIFLDELKDAARDESAPEYVRTAAAEAVAAIQSARQAKAARIGHFCSRCKRIITEDEYWKGFNKWGRPYCRHCFDEKLLEDKNFEATVEGAKNRRSELGTAVQSRGEKIIADFLESEGIAYEYDERYMIAADVRIRPDFYLPEFDVYIEYFGMDTPEYRDNMLKKRLLYQRAGKKLVSASYKDEDIIGALRKKLSRYFRI